MLKSLSQDSQISLIKDLYKVGITKGAVKKELLMQQTNPPIYTLRLKQ